MPKLKGKTYAYTKKGKEAYRKALMKKKKRKDAKPQTSKADQRRDKLRGYDFDEYRRGKDVRSIDALPRTDYGVGLDRDEAHINKNRSKMGY